MTAARLADLIADALVDAGLIAPDRMAEPAAVAGAEIEVRLAMGDVIVSGDPASPGARPEPRP